MKNLYLVTNDERLYQKFRLLLRDSHTVIKIDRPSKEGPCFVDLEFYKGDTGGTFTMSRNKECDISLPFDFERIKEVLSCEKGQKKLRLSASGRTCTLGEREIRLTDAEYRLLAMLYNNEGFVGRGDLLHGVWDEDTDEGVVNVYIHYLRTKLEIDGEKVILSSRKEGYMLSPKYK